jgi:hypothetical protein
LLLVLLLVVPTRLWNLNRGRNKSRSRIALRRRTHARTHSSSSVKVFETYWFCVKLATRPLLHQSSIITFVPSRRRLETHRRVASSRTPRKSRVARTGHKNTSGHKNGPSNTHPKIVLTGPT